MNLDSLSRLRRGLRLHFGPDAAVFVDPVLWLVGLVAVDLLRLDAWLQSRHPEYGANESMSGFVRRRYGGKAERFIAHWLEGEPR